MTESQARSAPASDIDQLPEALRCAIRAAVDKKAFDVVVLNLPGSGAFTDYFLLCSAHNTRQVSAIVDAIKDQLRAMRTRPSHIEGSQHATWVLMDFFDFVVHVFTEDTRLFYDLERLWGSARRIKLPDTA